jgi:ketosteroid isomerase-like protein
MELVSSLYAAWERGDWRSTDWADPEIEFMIVDGPAPGSSRGVAGMVEAYRGILSAWEGYRTAPTEHRVLDEQTILSLITITGRGKASGLELQAQGANLFQIREGKVTRLAIYWSRERALADLGLPPEEPA